jgi:hypothetical protein
MSNVRPHLAALSLRVTQADYNRASAFILSHLRRQGASQTSLKPLSILAYLLYAIPLFVIITAPNGQTESTRTAVRAAVLALVVVPFLFALGVARLRKADARALSFLEPPMDEAITIEANAANLRITTAAMDASFPWSAVALFVLDSEFAVILLPRIAPLPLTCEGSTTPGEFFTLLQHMQQYKAASEA